MVGNTTVRTLPWIILGLLLVIDYVHFGIVVPNLSGSHHLQQFKLSNQDEFSSTIHPKEVGALLNEAITSEPPAGTILKSNSGVIDWSQYGHLVLYHSRKAGGTTLLFWGRKVAQKHNLTFSHQEGLIFDPDDWKIVHNNKKVLIFTSLRPPVDRVLSSFEFDWLFQNPHDGGINTEAALQHFIQQATLEKENRKSIKTVTRPGLPGIDEGPKVRRGWVWICVEECYSRWFGGWNKTTTETTTEIQPKPYNDSIPITTTSKKITVVPDTQSAAQRLNDMEIFWVNDFNNPEYMDWITHRWDTANIPMRSQQAGKETYIKDDFKRDYTDQEINQLNAMNRNDALLYEALRQKWSTITNIKLT